MQQLILRVLAAGMLVGLLAPEAAHAQFDKKWLSGGSLHNWYSAVGAETESQGFVGTQQDGMRWPGIYDYTDMQAWKGLWIGARGVRDVDGTEYAVRVVHAGPRVTGTGEFYPVDFRLLSRFALPEVYVDGAVSEGLAAMTVDEVDETIPADQMIVNRVNTLLGLTVERRVLQFAQEYHDNYHVIEYTFTNTGNTDDDAEIELPDQTLVDVVPFLQWRWAVAKETRYVIGNGTGWGMNTMIDGVGDGDGPDYGRDFRATFAWHGYFPAFTAYDNLGGPILPEALPAPQIAPTDTLGRLGASQFVGVVTLHADASATDETDDPSQPAFTTWFGSDESFTSQNDPFNPSKMQTEYAAMTTDRSNRHAYVVEPSGMEGFLAPSGDPALGTTGGHTAAIGYGPYTIPPGESVRIVIAEAAAGLSREENERVGRLFKQGQITALEKNEYVFQSRDSLFQTFERALANYRSGYAIPQGPPPPDAFEINSGGDRISLSWSYPLDAPLPEAFEIYRARGAYDSTYTLVHTAGPGETTYDDTTPIRGIDYYYYLVAVGSPGDNDGAGGTPAGRALRSSRYYTQAYTPARLKRPAGESLTDIRVVPNPFHIAAASSIRWPDQTDKLGFLNIPGRARIEIYTETGELVDTIVHEDGSGDAYWDHTTSSRQVVASGLYIAVIKDLETGEAAFRKFVIIR